MTRVFDYYATVSGPLKERLERASGLLNDLKVVESNDDDLGMMMDDEASFVMTPTALLELDNMTPRTARTNVLAALV